MQDMFPRDVTLLARLLFLDARQTVTPCWLREQEQHLFSFPDSLLKPFDLLPRLAMTLPCAPEKAILCKTHQPLNSRLIHQIFLEVSAECTTRQAKLEDNPFLYARVSAFLLRLHKINSLWLSPDTYCRAFHAPPLAPRYKRIPSGCEACILASIGGNHGILSDLRASILARKKHGQPTAPLLPLVEAWIDWTAHHDSIREESDILKEELRKCRRQIQKARRWKCYNITGNMNIAEGDAYAPAASSTLVNDKIDELEVKDENDAEVSIIDFYANGLSFLTDDDHVEAVHLDFRNSLMFCPASGTFQRNAPVPAGRRPQSVTYSESVYDVEASRASFPCYGLQGKSVNEYAESYRMLVEMGEVEEMEEQQDGRKTRRETKTEIAR
jgi:hypothetical protein